LESLFSRDFDERSTGALTNIVQQAQTLSPADKAAIKNALMNKIGTLQAKRDDSELDARAPLSANSFGGSLLSSAAGGAASGLVGNLLGLIEGLFRRDFNDAHEDLYMKRDVSSVSTIIKQAQNLSPADKAAVKTALMNKIGTLAPTNSKRSTGLEANAALGEILKKFESLFGRDEFELEARLHRPHPAGPKLPPNLKFLPHGFDKLPERDYSELEARARLSAGSLGGSIVSSAAGGAASGLVGNLLGLIEGLFRRDEQELEARAPLSANGLGGSLISSAAGGAASGLVGNLLSLIEGLFRRDLADVHDEVAYVKRDVNSISTIIKQAQTLSASDKAAVKTALMNKIGSLQSPSKRLSASGAAGTALGGLASVGAKSLVGGLLEKLESLFQRDEEEALMAREELHGMERRSPLSASSFKPSGNGVTSQVLGGLAGGAASGLVGNLLSEFESLFERSEEFSINELD
ncbi:hypothetical protein DL93DRAFT_2082300, partial [Clavulina sp. PMI_390]